MPVTLEAAKQLKVTGFLLVMHCPVLKSKELELVAGKPTRKERRSVPIAVRSRSAWLKSTQQHGVGSSTKVKKTSTKCTATEPVSLGKFFDNTRLQSRARPKPKAKGVASTQDQDAPICGPEVHCEDKTRAATVPVCDSSVVTHDTVVKGYSAIDAEASPDQSVQHQAGCRVDIPPIAPPGETLSGSKRTTAKPVGPQKLITGLSPSLVECQRLFPSFKRS